MTTISVDVCCSAPTTITIQTDMLTARWLAAVLSRMENVPVEIDPTGVGQPFYQMLQSDGVEVVKKK